MESGGMDVMGRDGSKGCGAGVVRTRRLETKGKLAQDHHPPSHRE